MEQEYRQAGSRVLLGIDAGGTHTDAVLCSGGRVIGRGKTTTDVSDLPGSITRVLDELEADAGRPALARAERVTLGTTLLVNAVVQQRLEPVGLLLTAGPGLAPERFATGDYVCVAPGGLDHRGVEVSPLRLDRMRETVRAWHAKGVNAFACVGRFSPRNPAHEQAMARIVAEAAPGAAVTLGHRISGELNFPRRIVSAYYNSAVLGLHNRFLDAVQDMLERRGLKAPVHLLRADGGAVPVEASRQLPVHSLLSGPAASVMGVMAVLPDVDTGCILLMDMGGTTTDLAVLVDGSPVVDQDGMRLNGRRTLARALHTVSIGVGGDSLLTVRDGRVQVGPVREGPAMAFGGSRATLLDALNVLNADGLDMTAGDTEQSRRGMAALATELGAGLEQAARLAWDDAASRIDAARRGLLADINARPLYTLRELRTHVDAVPGRVALVGGPALCVRRRLEQALGLPVAAAPEADVANAVGAALTRPSARVAVYADTGRGTLLAPALDLEEELGRRASLQAVKDRALALLRAQLAANGIRDCPLQTVQADLFATLSDSGRGTRDMRVVCQVVPGLEYRIEQAGQA